MANIAFFGLGAMGKPIATNLLAAGNRLSVYDLPQARDCDSKTSSWPREASTRTGLRRSRSSKG